jgi:hypothetical protein
MTVSMTVNTRPLKAALAKARQAVPAVRKETLIAIANVYGKIVMETAPIDTGRFIAGEAQGLNEAGAGPFPVQKVKAAGYSQKRRDEITRMLEAQLEWWRYQKNRLEARGVRSIATGKQSKDYTLAVKNYQRCIKYLAEWRASEGTGAVIGLQFWQRLKEAKRRKDQNPDMVLTRAYSRVYGGKGRLIQYNGREVLSLRNLEPHAYIVEHNTRVRANALRAMAGTVKKVSQAYTKQMAAASGLSVTG